MTYPIDEKDLSIQDPDIDISQPSTEIEAPAVGARFWIRAGARIIDLVVHNVIYFVSGIFGGLAIAILAVFTVSDFTALQNRLSTTSPIDYVLALVGYALYHMICESLFGATPGKLIFKLRVVNDKGGFANLKSALIRSAAFFIDALFWGIVAAVAMRGDPQARRVGDRWAHTVVVKKINLVPQQLRPGWHFIPIFILACAVEFFVVLLTLLLKLFD